MEKTIQQQAGKFHNTSFKELIFPYTGAHRSEVITGPEYGVDVAIVQLPNGMAMALTSDPLSLIPTLGLKESAWLSVQLMANDMATTGLAPQYAQFVLNLPTTLSREDFDLYWQYIHEFCARLGVAITGGHTGRFEGQNSTVAGGGTMITIGSAEQMITSKGAKAGDIIIMTKSSALVATAILALSFPLKVKEALGKEVYDEAAALFYESSAVEAGLAAGEMNRHAPTVTAMHDVTEGGILGALCELAHASSCGLLIENEQIPIGNAQQKIGELFQLDPRYCVGAGAMVITVKEDKAESIVKLLEIKSIKATIIGKVLPATAGVLIQSNGLAQPLLPVAVDPYWTAFQKAFQDGWK